MASLAAKIRDKQRQEEEERRKRQAEAEAQQQAQPQKTAQIQGATAGMPLFLQPQLESSSPEASLVSEPPTAEAIPEPETEAEASVEATETSASSPTKALEASSASETAPLEESEVTSEPETKPEVPASLASEKPASTKAKPVTLTPEQTTAIAAHPDLKPAPEAEVTSSAPTPLQPSLTPDTHKAETALPETAETPTTTTEATSPEAATPETAAPQASETGADSTTTVADTAQAGLEGQMPTALAAPESGDSALAADTTAPATEPSPAAPEAAGGLEADASPAEEAAELETEEQMEAAAPAEAPEEEAPPPEPTEVAPEAAAALGAQATTEASETPAPTSDTASTASSISESATPPETETPEAPEPEAEPPETEAIADEPDHDATTAPTSGATELPGAEKQAALDAIAPQSSGEPSLGGGGGGGSAIADLPQPDVPDVSQSSPSDALATVSQLPPAQLQSALGGVSAAASHTVGEKRTDLAENPPEMARPSGAPVVREAPIEFPEAPSTTAETDVERTPEGETVDVPAPAPLPPEPAPPTAAVPEPPLQGTPEGELSDEDVSRLRHSLSRLPAQDPGLEVQAGPPPTLELEGNADPERAHEQRQELQQSTQDLRSQGQQDAAQPMGETEIYPVVPTETLRANVSGATAGAGSQTESANAAVTAAAQPGGDASSIIAHQLKGQEIQAAVTQGRADIATRQTEHAQTVATEQARSREEISQLEAENAEAQSQERTDAQTEVQGLREDWSEEQQDLVTGANTEAQDAVETGETDIAEEQEQADAEATQHLETGEQEAATARQTGEQEAQREQQRGEQESSGFFGWLARRARAFFDGIKRAIQAAFEQARRLVRQAIERAKSLALAVIERARQAVVSIIRRVGDALIAIGDRLLAAFPGLRERFRNAIQAAVSRAEAAVNRLANQLKEGVQRALDALGGALDAALGLLERGLLAAVDAVNSVVQGAIRFAESVAQALGNFARLVGHVAAGPGRWVRNLGAAIVDGIRNHLWRAFQAAVKDWFNQKLEEVLGLGTAIWDLLRRGGLSLSAIGRMVWEGLKAAIPVALIQILIEKLVAMIVPAAGAVMAIVEALQAAWGTVSRIIQAFGRFIAFLLAVRSGNAGPQFAAALAAAAVVVIDFVANWLLRRLRRPAGRIAARIRAIARRIGRRLGRAARRLGTRLRRRTQRRRGTSSRRRDQNRDRRNQERLDRAVRELQPRVNRLLQNGVGGIRLRAQLLFWRARYRLRRLELDRQNNRTAKITAVINPTRDVLPNMYMPQGEALRDLIHRVVEGDSRVRGDTENSLLNRRDVQETATWMDQTYNTSSNQQQHAGVGGIGHLASVSRERRQIGQAQQPGTQPRQNINYYTPVTEDRRIQEWQQDSRSANAYVHGAHDYPREARDINHMMQELGMNDEGEVASFIRGAVRSGEIPGALDRPMDEFRASVMYGHADSSNTRMQEAGNQLRRERRGTADRPGWRGAGPRGSGRESHIGHLSALSLLMFKRESIRYSSNVALAPMTLMLIEQGSQEGGMTFNEAFAGHEGNQSRLGGGGAYPMSMQGAQGAAEELERERQIRQQGGQPPPRSAEAQELARREIALIERWIHQQLRTDGYVGFINEADAVRYIRRKLEAYYGLRHRR